MTASDLPSSQETPQPAPGPQAAENALASASEYLPRVRAALVRTAERLRAGRLDEGNQLYAELIDALGVVVFVLSAAPAQLGERAAELTGVEEEANRCLPELLEAQEQRDWIRVADALEYELGPLLADWQARLARVRGVDEEAAR